MALIAACILTTAGVAAATSYFGVEEPADPIIRNEVFHVTLADPDLYADGGIYKSSFEIDHDVLATNNGLEERRFVFDFVPNGSSPEVLSITLSGKNLAYSEDFMLEGTRHEAGLGEFYTWEYLGQDAVIIPNDSTAVDIVINPNGNTQGSVSVYLYDVPV